MITRAQQYTAERLGLARAIAADTGPLADFNTIDEQAPDRRAIGLILITCCQRIGAHSTGENAGRRSLIQCANDAPTRHARAIFNLIAGKIERFCLGQPCADQCLRQRRIRNQ